MCGASLEDVVGAAADNHARLFRCDAADDPALGYEQRVVIREALVERCLVILEYHLIEQRAGKPLFVLRDELLAEVAFAGNQRDELLVVEVDAQLAGYGLTRQMSAAAVFARYGDDGRQRLDVRRMLPFSRVGVGQPATYECQPGHQYPDKGAGDERCDDGAFAHPVDAAGKCPRAENRHDDERHVEAYLDGAEIAFETQGCELNGVFGANHRYVGHNLEADAQGQDDASDNQRRYFQGIRLGGVAVQHPHGRVGEYRQDECHRELHQQFDLAFDNPPVCPAAASACR